MVNKKNLLANLERFLFQKDRKGNIKTLLKNIVIEEMNIPSCSEEYDDYEHYIDSKYEQIVKRLSATNKKGIEININDDNAIIIVDNAITSILYLFSSINGNNFEKLCENILNNQTNFNIKNSKKYSEEDSLTIDITGSISILESISAETRVYGQIKNQRKDVALNQLKQFVGGVKGWLSENNVNIGYMHSHVLIYITSSDFHHDAIEYMKKLGIVYINGSQLAELVKNSSLDINDYI